MKLGKGIQIEEVTHEHILVMIKFNKPCILAREDVDKGLYNWMILGNSENILTEGNAYRGVNTLRETLKSWEDDEIHVYTKENWKKALKWLMKNC